MNPSRLKKILWFFDPYQSNADSLVQEMYGVKDWINQQGLEILPFYSLSPKTIGWMGLGSAPNLEHFVPSITTTLNEKLTEGGVDFLLEPRVFISLHFNQREIMTDIKAFCDQEEIGSTLIFASSKSSIERFYLGSFSETLLFSLNLPSLVLPLQRKDNWSPSDPLMIPFDLSEENHSAITRFFTSNPPLPSSKIVLFHKLEKPEEAIVQTGMHFAGGGWVSLDEFYQSQFKEATERCNQLKDNLEKLGYEVTHSIDSSPGNIENGIRNLVETEPASALILFTNATPSSALLLGSLTRQLLRDPPSPLWVLHSRFEE